MNFCKLNNALVFLSFLCVFACSCAHSSGNSHPGDTENSGRSSVGSPGKGFIIGRGESTASMAEAEQLAKSDVSAQIESSIKSQIDISQKSGMDAESDEHSVSNRIVVTSSFDHAELIKIDRSSCRKLGNRYEAVAVLDRQASDRFLENLWRESFDQLVALYHQCEVAADRKAFVVCWHGMMDARRKLSRISCQRAAIAGHRSELFEPMSIPSQILEKRRQIVRDNPLVLSVRDSTHSVDVDALASRALQQSGVAKSGSCDRGGLRMVIEPSETCRLGATSYVCEVKLAIGVSPCVSPEVMTAESESEPGAFRASHGSSKDRALQDAWKALSLERVSPVVLSILERILPL